MLKFDMTSRPLQRLTVGCRYALKIFSTARKVEQLKRPRCICNMSGRSYIIDIRQHSCEFSLKYQEYKSSEIYLKISLSGIKSLSFEGMLMLDKSVYL